MNLVSTTTKQLHSSQQNWKLNLISFGTSNHSPISQTPIKAPICTKALTPPPPPNPYSLQQTTHNPHCNINFNPTIIHKIQTFAGK